MASEPSWHGSKRRWRSKNCCFRVRELSGGPSDASGQCAARTTEPSTDSPNRVAAMSFQEEKEDNIHSRWRGEKYGNRWNNHYL